MRWFIPAILTCLFLTFGCLGEDDENIACIQQGDPEGTILVTVGCRKLRTQPFYLWDDQEGVVAVEVRKTADGEVVWRIFDSSLQNVIEQPVEHGESPPGTAVEGTETELEYNVGYIVEVERITTSLASAGSGTREFTILPVE